MTAEELKSIRQKTGMTQSQFAEKTGVNLRTLQNWEVSRNGINAMFEARLRELGMVKNNKSVKNEQ